MQSITGENQRQNLALPLPKRYRFEIFKGSLGPDGVVRRVRSAGVALLTEGMKTYTVHMKTLFCDTFYLLPEQKNRSEADFAILTRELSTRPPRRYFWHNVGTGVILPAPNHGLVRLTWDFFGATDLYMSLYPISSVWNGSSAEQEQEIA